MGQNAFVRCFLNPVYDLLSYFSQEDPFLLVPFSGSTPDHRR